MMLAMPSTWHQTVESPPLKDSHQLCLGCTGLTVHRHVVRDLSNVFQQVRIAKQVHSRWVVECDPRIGCIAALCTVHVEGKLAAFVAVFIHNIS